MEKKCKGCGITLQNTDKKALGYVVDMEMDYCQRCFRMTHYDAHLVKDFIPDNETILNDLSALKGQFIWVIDIFDLETSLRSSLTAFYGEYECLIILNKCDLLPENINLEKLADYVKMRIGEIGVRCRAIITRGISGNFVQTLDRFIDRKLPLIITGVANVGKSTIINELLEEKVVTTNPYPATTMRINEIESEKYHIFDSAGLWINESMQACLNVKDLKRVVPDRTVRPTVYQLKGEQALSLSGLTRIEMNTDDEYTAVTYLSNQLKVHRGKTENVRSLWQKNFGRDELAVIPTQYRYPEDFKRIHFQHTGKSDYFICGLGFVTITAARATVDIYVPSPVQVIKRKAMI